MAKTPLEMAAEGLVDISHMQRESIDQLGTKIDALGGKIDGLNTRIDGLDASIAKLDGSILNLSMVVQSQQIVTQSQNENIAALIAHADRQSALVEKLLSKN